MRSVSDQDHPACMPVLEIINFVTGPNLRLKVTCLCSRNDLRNRESPVTMTALDLRRLRCEYMMLAREGNQFTSLNVCSFGACHSLLAFSGASCVDHLINPIVRKFKILAETRPTTRNAPLSNRTKLSRKSHYAHGP